MTWSRIARHLVRSLPRSDRDRLESELFGFFDQTEVAGRPLGGRYAASIATLVARRRARSAMQWAPTILTGAPIAAMCVAAVLAVYGAHLEPWRSLDHTDSTSTTAAFITETAPYLVLPIVALALFAGFRAVQRIRQGSYVLPAALVIASGWSTSQSGLFIERTGWFAQDLNASHLQTISPYSVALLSIALVIPLAFLAADAALKTPHQHEPLAPLPRAVLAPVGVATMALTAAVMPLVSPVGLAMVLASDRWSRRTRIALAVAVVAPLALLLIFED
jgi:hypothetical protein